MIKLLITLASVWMLCTASIRAQIMLEYTFDSTWVGGDRFYCTDIGNNDFKYVFLDGKTNSFSLYNLDMSTFEADILIPVSDSIIAGFRAIYITKTLFDCDSNNIEYVYEHPLNVNHKFYVLRTDGTILLEVDSANGPYGFGGSLGGSITQRPILNTSAGAKLFLQKRDNNSVPKILVYSLCGEAPFSFYDFSKPQQYLKLFPNPANEVIIFELDQPNNVEVFNIYIFDSNAKKIIVERPVSTTNRYYLNVKGLSSGTYFYSLLGKNKVYQTGKFILTK